MKDSDCLSETEDIQPSEIRAQNPLQELTAPKLKRIQQQYPTVNLWDIYPEIYEKDISGDFIQRKDGTPKRRSGKLPGSPHNEHSDTKARKSAQKHIRTQKKRIATLKEKARKAEDKLRKNTQTIRKLEGRGGNRLFTENEIEGLPTHVRDDLRDKQTEIIFKPNPGPQTAFLAATEKEVLYGGAAGGGKSYALLADFVRYAGIKEARGLLIRRTMPELRELMDKSYELYPRAFPGAKFSKQEKIWMFPSGAKLEFGYCEKDSDVYRYQGQAYTWIAFDELTQ